MVIAATRQESSSVAVAVVAAVVVAVAVVVVVPSALVAQGGTAGTDRDTDSARTEASDQVGKAKRRAKPESVVRMNGRNDHAAQAMVLDEFSLRTERFMAECKSILTRLDLHRPSPPESTDGKQDEETETDLASVLVEYMKKVEEHVPILMQRTSSRSHRGPLISPPPLVDEKKTETRTGENGHGTYAHRHTDFRAPSSNTAQRRKSWHKRGGLRHAIPFAFVLHAFPKLRQIARRLMLPHELDDKPEIDLGNLVRQLEYVLHACSLPKNEFDEWKANMIRECEDGWFMDPIKPVSLGFLDDRGQAKDSDSEQQQQEEEEEDDWVYLELVGFKRWDKLVVKDKTKKKFPTHGRRENKYKYEKGKQGKIDKDKRKGKRKWRGMVEGMSQESDWSVSDDPTSSIIITDDTREETEDEERIHWSEDRSTSEGSDEDEDGEVEWSKAKKSKRERERRKTYNTGKRTKT
ncbi:hypothetical protein M231_05628 [Tremella mesenterica]|uniref:Uncharacterized protein n=1 Tax=Tremella mesenterica TaxID=5217 RepID=A0A4Q1BHN2_TREME|nr:hypothetical protein M231_05628 [Tremella mesenterica]